MLKAPYFKLKYEFLKEVGTLIATFMVLTLVAYLSFDFFSLPDLSSTSSFSILVKRIFFAVFTFIMAIFASDFLSINFGDSFFNFAFRAGETKTNLYYIHIFQFLSSFGIRLFIPVIASYFLIGGLPKGDLFFLLGTAFVVLLIRSFFHLGSSVGKSKKIVTRVGSKPFWSLFFWRLSQLTRVGQSGAMSVQISLIIILSMSLIKKPYFSPELLFLPSFIGGIFLGFGLLFQFRQDLHFSWYEYLSGIQKNTVIKVYCVLSLALSFPMVCLIGLFIFMRVGFLSLNDNDFKPLLFFLTGPLLAPGLVAQVDPRRPWIQGIILTIIGFFVASAILYSWFGALLIPAIAYYCVVHSPIQDSRRY